MVNGVKLAQETGCLFAGADQEHGGKRLPMGGCFFPCVSN